ncbi:MAG TPA: histidine phosphatase family protein [Rhizomicrobium sp.]|nr:histidine phosphatase family protein [Rhizomicrobium sp.]
MRRLLLLRHAKAVPAGSGIDDHGRELTARGRDDTAKIGRYVEKEGYAPNLILSSTSQRTMETVEGMAGELSSAPRVDHLEALYLAEPEVILSVIRLAPDKMKRVMVVGHNPGLEHLATLLAREPVKRKERDRFDMIEEKFPTAALAVLDFDVARWRDVAPGGGALADFVRPRDL